MRDNHRAAAETTPAEPASAQDGTPRPGPAAAPRGAVSRFLARFFHFFSSMRLTVACLALALVLVFAGTMAQVELGLYRAQNEFFRSLIVYWGPPGAGWRIPVLPGGYLVGGVLMVNLIASHFRRFEFSRRKIGLWLVHFGLILLLLGQFLTDVFSRETRLHLRNGESKNYTEADREVELAVADTTDPDMDKVVAIAQSVLMKRGEIRHPELPFTLRVPTFYANSTVEGRPADSAAPAAATRDIGARALVKEAPHTTTMNQRDVPSAVVEIVTDQGSQGTWLVSEYLDRPQSFTLGQRTYQLTMRLRRFYKPFSLQLVEFRHDVYPGTQVPKNFSSRVVLERPETKEKREVLIYMNNPLRYWGETYYQADFDRDNQGTVLQVVRNPSWLTPYFSCVLVGLGLTLHFLTHLWGQSRPRKTV